MIESNLRRKKKQPKYVEAGKLKQVESTPQDLGDELHLDWMFMKTCRDGSQQTRIAHGNEVNCRYLHQKNPYLKLGPFKVLSH